MYDMKPTATDFEQIKEKLTDYRTKVEQGNKLSESGDYLELDVEGGSIWLHPQSDGTTVEIYFFNDSGEFAGTGMLLSFLTENLGFPSSGNYSPSNPDLNNNREMYRVDFEYFQ